jgi:hypothetical protein
VPLQIDLRRKYSRNDPRGRFPRQSGAPEIDYNRLALFWRPIIDMTDSRLASMRLAMIRPVSEWIADPTPGRLCWFSRIGVAGLRTQVLRHAGLDGYDCRRPEDLPSHLRTPAWQQLVDALGRLDDLDPHTRGLVAFHLAQLTFCHYAAARIGLVEPTGQPGQDHYAYQAARAYSRIPGNTGEAMPVFEALATNRHDPQLAVLAAAQAVGQGVRNLNDIACSQRFEQLGRRVPPSPDDWHDHLARSRFHRAVALLRIVERRPDDMREELQEAWSHHEQMAALAPTDDIARLVVVENRRILIESEIKARYRVEEDEATAQVRAWAEELAQIDPYCPEARLVVGDGYAATGDYATAASWYARAGELGTGDGATGWYRAGQCYHHLGDEDSAINAMGHCLELDTTAVEPRQYLIEHGLRVPAATTGGMSSVTVDNKKRTRA